MRLGGTGLLFVLALFAPQSDNLKANVSTWVAAHEKEIVGELLEALAIPNVAADQSNIRRNAEHLRAMLARHGFTPEILETAGNPLVYGALNVPGRDADGPVLLPLRRAARRRGEMEPAGSVHAGGARRRARRADLRAVGVRRQGADRRADGRRRRAEGVGPGALVQPPRHPRRRGRGQLAEPRAGDRALQGQAARRPDGHPRRPGALERPADGRLRRARHRHRRPDGVRTEERRAQRQLRQLDAEPGAAPRDAARLDEGRRRAGEGRRVLRRRRAADAGGARDARRGSRRLRDGCCGPSASPRRRRRFRSCRTRCSTRRSTSAAWPAPSSAPARAPSSPIARPRRSTSGW